MAWGPGYAGAQPGPPTDQDPFTAAERDTRAMVSAGWWSGAPPQQRQHAIAGRVLVLPDGTWWLFGAWARWYRWHPSDGQWYLCPPPQATATRRSARPVQQGVQVPGLPPHVVPAGPDFGFDAPPALPFVGHPVPAALTARVRATLESAAALPVADYPHWWSLFSPGTPSTVAVSWGVMLWCAAAPVFDSRFDDQMLGLWAPFRAKPLPTVDGPRWLTPPPLEALVGLYAERLRANRVDAAVVVLRTMWALGSALREDARFQARADALLAILGATLNNPTVDYEALPYGDQALVQQWLTRCPPHLVPAMRNESSPGDNLRHAYYDLAQVIAKLAGDPGQPAYIEPRLIAAALIAADLGVARQDLVARIVPWLDPEIRFTVQAVLSQNGHPLRRLWPVDATLPDLLRAGLTSAEDREQLLGAMYGVDLAWCRLGGIPARPRGFPVPTAVTAEIIGAGRAKAAAAAAAVTPPPGVAPLGSQYPQNQPVPPGPAGPGQAGQAGQVGQAAQAGPPAGQQFGPQYGQPAQQPGQPPVPSFGPPHAARQPGQGPGAQPGYAPGVQPGGLPGALPDQQPAPPPPAWGGGQPVPPGQPPVPGGPAPRPAGAAAVGVPAPPDPAQPFLQQPAQPPVEDLGAHRQPLQPRHEQRSEPAPGPPGPGVPGASGPAAGGRAEEPGGGERKSRWTPGYEDPPAALPTGPPAGAGVSPPGTPPADPPGTPAAGAAGDPSATRLDDASMRAPGGPAPGDPAGPVRTRVIGADQDGDGPAPPVPPAPAKPPGTRIMSETMMADLDFAAAPVPDRPIEDIEPPPAEQDRHVGDHFGISYVSGVPGRGEDVPDVAAFLQGLRDRLTAEEEAGASARDPHATTVDDAGPPPGAINVLLVGSPHTGQRRMARIIALLLADAGLGDGSIRITGADDVRGATPDRAEEILRGGPVLLFEGLDQAVAEAADPVALARAVRSVRSRPPAVRTCLVATCEPRAYRRLVQDHPELVAVFTSFRLPDLTDTENRLTLLHVLADERRVTVGDAAKRVVREDLDRLRGPGDLVNARLVEAYLDQACQRHLGRIGGTGDRLVLTPEDFESIAEQIEPALRPVGDIDGFLRRLDALAGLDEVKIAIEDMVAHGREAAERARYGVHADGPARRLVFVGPSGVGKTTVAGLVGGIYAALGLLGSGHLVACRPVHLAGRDDLDTEHRVATMIDQAVGGVLLIQQAHLLAREPAVVAELLRRTAEHQDDLVVICTGPVAETRRFLDDATGFRREFATVLEFGEPTDRELVQLFQNHAERDLYLLDEELRVELLARFARLREGAGFAFARTARELFEQTVARQAARLAGSSVDAATGARLTVADLPESALEQMLGHFQQDQSR